MDQIRSLTLTAGLLAGAALVTAQNTVGTTIYNPAEATPGYTLLYPHNQPNAFLINACGEVVHSWEGALDQRPGNTAYLQPNGDLILTWRPASIAGNPIWAGGGGATVERRTWDNEVIWTYTQNDDSARFHHDIAPMPNGNVLAICWERVDSATAVADGRLPELLDASGLWYEKVVELQPDGAGGAEVVWEWKMRDHLVQNIDPQGANYGDPAAFPGRIDVNYSTESGAPADLVHMNSIDYNPLNDHILMSAPEYDEIWIIDHSALSDGDLKWRWGNPEAYGSGDSTQHHLHYQHDANWVDAPYQNPSPFFGRISVFNNRVPDAGGQHSELTVVAPPYDDYENTYLYDGGVFAPAAAEFTWAATDTASFGSSGLSSFQPLQGPRFLVCEGRSGRTSEITLAGDTVWQYVTPFQAGQPVAQGTELLQGANLTFRATRYPENYPAFVNLVDPAGVVLELNPTPLSACVPCDLNAEVTWVADASFSVNITGGTPPFEAVWTNNESSSSCEGLELTVADCPDLFVGLEGVFLTVVLTDANGCTAEAQGGYFGVGEAGQAMRVYPNPSNGMLYLEGLDAEVHLLDLNGRVVAATRGGVGRWTLPDLTPGMYVVQSGDFRQLLHIQHD